MMTEKTRYYMLGPNKELKTTDDMQEWAEWFEDGSHRIVKQEWVGDVWVSTVFLGVDHNFGLGPPLLFETLVFEDETWHDSDRYSMERTSTWQQATLAHQMMCAQILQDMSPLRYGCAPFIRWLKRRRLWMRLLWAASWELCSVFAKKTAGYVKRLWRTVFRPNY